MSAVELLTIPGSKGLSADHVIIVGFDDVNMKYISRNAFYVALTRARKSLHLVSALGAGGSSAPHGFLTNLPIAHLEFYSYTKTAGVLKTIGDEAEFRQYLSNAGYFRRPAAKSKRPSRH